MSAGPMDSRPMARLREVAGRQERGGRLLD